MPIICAVPVAFN